MNAQKTTSFLRNNRINILIVVIIILSFALLSYILFADKKISTLFPNMSPTPTPRIYSTLDKKLNTFLNSEKPQEAAKEQQIAIQGKDVKALITLKDESFFFTEMYGKQVLRYGKYIQAIIKFDKLEELAKNPKIESIKATPDRSNVPPGVDVNNLKNK